MHLDETHDARRLSWVASANGHAEFPIQNLPFGVFSTGGGAPRGGVAIGDGILDLGAALDAGLFTGAERDAAAAAAGGTLNAFMALGAEPRVRLRRRLSELLAADTRAGGEAARHAARLLHKAADCTLHLPAAIGAYTDFFAGIHHAYNGGVRAGRQPPLTPNYKHMPVAYHSRASSVLPSGTAVRRPAGQTLPAGSDAPGFGPCSKLDFELELGVWIGPGNALGEPIPIARAAGHVVGLCLLNDWSARDIQRWEMQPLGPFLSKNFGTTISPWIVTLEALAPFRLPQPPRPAGDPQPLAHLWDDADQGEGAFDIGLEVLILTAAMRARGAAPHRLSASNARHLYWTIAQMVAHHACGGCNLQSGDIFGSGTISAPDAGGYGSFSELSDDGRTPLALPAGETRAYIEDGDEIILRAVARREGYAPVGFGECRGRILPAR